MMIKSGPELAELNKAGRELNPPPAKYRFKWCIEDTIIVILVGIGITVAYLLGRYL